MLDKKIGKGNLSLFQYFFEIRFCYHSQEKCDRKTLSTLFLKKAQNRLVITLKKVYNKAIFRKVGEKIWTIRN